ncbi:spore coat protein [Vallitalea longa]|uniref:Spore coat protein n=1 Tax=Vallitalea longa TaxID=2936439 RepID=A0A9W6DFC7_9FIRM|nr:CotS family spore coat protein [Vallitalea longa]GKX28564.1 spore coat protein [Vallitalea longa]
MLEEYNNIFEQFEIKVKNGYKGRGAYILDTNKGLKLFKEIRMHREKIKFMYEIEEYLYKKGFTNIDRLTMSRDKNPFCEDDGTIYIMKNWVNGREIFFNDEEEIYDSVKNLAVLHKCGSNFPIGSKYKNYVKLGSLPNKLNRHNIELVRIRNKIRKMGKWSEFDICFLSSFNYYYKKAVEALSLIELSEYNNLVNGYHKSNVITHGQYIHHNILVSNKKLHTMNFEYCNIDIPVIDLYRLMRKVLEKNDWNIGLGIEAIEKYISINPLSKEELDILLYLIMYPEKFWKISNYYFNLNRAWKPKQSLIKLNKLINQKEKKERFIRELKKTLSSK